MSLGFIEKAIKIHGDTYDYSLVEYKGWHTKIKIICKIHGEFLQTPHSHLNKKAGCKLCANLKIGKSLVSTKNVFIDKAIFLHGVDTYDYSKVEYKTARLPVIIICKTHGEFNQTPDAHLVGKGCIQCGVTKQVKKRSKTQDKFLEGAKSKHGDTYDYSNVEYRSTHVKVCIVCKKHGKFWQAPSHHLNGEGCPKCRYPGFSKISLTWLNYVAFSKNIHIRTIMDENGEFRINNKGVDGYCKETNTVYEFHGDFFHGNPSNDKFPHDKINPISKKTYGELYQRTQHKKSEILALGYNYVEMWEYDWRRAIKAVIKIQRIWKSK
jgi:G:T-mismatch repair DNA endonuclease (very short patch repair protein)